MSKSYREDLTGQRFGRLTVLEFVPTEDKYSHWKYKCDCGSEGVVMGSNITGGKTRSCGCIQKRMAIQLKAKHYLHGTRVYEMWQTMKKRCYNPNQTHYKDYGGRGITVCDEWKDDFQTFYDWAMSNGYDDNLTIDRIDVNGNYTPSNCRFADMKIQARNRRNNIIVSYKGTDMCLSEAAEQSKVPANTLFQRYYRGDRGERLFRPIRKKKK